MKITYNYAVVSFCWDLTDPSAESVPVAVVGVGTVQNSDFWFYVVRPALGDSLRLEEPSRAILNKFPDILQEQVATGLRQVPPARFLSWVHDQLRNSLHVSEIDAREANLRDDPNAGASRKPRDLKQWAIAQLTADFVMLYNEKVLRPRIQEDRSEAEDEGMPETYVQRYPVTGYQASA